MDRRTLLKRAAAPGPSVWLAGCGGGGESVAAGNSYKQSNLVANSAAYQPLILEPRLIDAWGIAIRPAGAGGHFWVTGMGTSFEYAGDVNGTPLFADGLKTVGLPASGADGGAANGVLSAWTERKKPDGTFDRSPDALKRVDYGGHGSAFFGLAINPAESQLFVVDFGANPGQLLPAVESAGRGRGRLVEYTVTGQQVAVWDDPGVLNGPWGVVMAPANFGPFSRQLLVGNFSDGSIVGFDTQTRRATEYLRGADGNVLKIQGLWNLLFGNGASLGDANALYFAAGPAEETDGLFGSLRHVG